MEIRYFQIIIPIISLVLIYTQYITYKKGKARINETIVVSAFWLSVGLLAFFPDFFSDLIADVFGIKDNINALIFFSLGILFYFQLKMYKTIRNQEHLITVLTREMALNNRINIKVDKHPDTKKISPN